MIELLERWEDQRKPARVEVLLDISGSMGDPAGEEAGPTKLDLAVEAAVNAIGQFGPRDVVGLSIFSTRIGTPGNPDVVELVPPRVMDEGQRRAMEDALAMLTPTNGTPLYTATQQIYEGAVAAYDPGSINAVVLLSDGVNEDGDNTDDDAQLEELLALWRRGAKASGPNPSACSRSLTARMPTCPPSNSSPKRPTPPSTTPLTRPPSNEFSPR